jgi:hypothetical protein
MVERADVNSPSTRRTGSAILGSMSTLHVVPDARGNWRVFDEQRPLSQHPSATDAELAALSRAFERGGEEILVHDRYGRTRAPIRGLLRSRAEAELPRGLA